MSNLASAGKAGSETAFLSAFKTIEWRSRPREDFTLAIQHASAAGAYLAARRLALMGGDLLPNNDAHLQKCALVLSPPKVIRKAPSPDAALRANRNWLTTNRERFRGQWVALRNGDLLFSARSLRALANRIADPRGVLMTKVY